MACSWKLHRAPEWSTTSCSWCIYFQLLNETSFACVNLEFIKLTKYETFQQIVEKTTENPEIHNQSRETVYCICLIYPKSLEWESVLMQSSRVTKRSTIYCTNADLNWTKKWHFCWSLYGRMQVYCWQYHNVFNIHSQGY